MLLYKSFLYDMLKVLQNLVISCKVLWSYVFEVCDQFLHIAQCNGLQGATALYAANQTRGGPLFFLITTCTLGLLQIVQHMGPNCLPGLKPTLC